MWRALYPTIQQWNDVESPLPLHPAVE